MRVFHAPSLAGNAGNNGAWGASGDVASGQGRYDTNPIDFFPGTSNSVRAYPRAITDADVSALSGG